MFRSSHLQVLCKKGALKNFAKFTREKMCRSLLFNKAAGLPVATSLLFLFFSFLFCLYVFY